MRVWAPAIRSRLAICSFKATTSGVDLPVRARHSLKSSKAGVESGKSRTMSKASPHAWTRSNKQIQ